MKALITVLILALNLNLQAEELNVGVNTYSTDTIKELKIDSVNALIKNYLKSSDPKHKVADDVLYLVNGERTEMTPKELDTNLLTATSVEILESQNALIVNLIF